MSWWDSSFDYSNGRRVWRNRKSDRL